MLRIILKDDNIIFYNLTDVYFDRKNVVKSPFLDG
jgi:hypothetical protein